MKKIDVRIVPNLRDVQSVGQEKNSSFLCIENTVLTGMRHEGDENGNTWYEYATLKSVDADGNQTAGTISIEDVTWGDWFVEAAGDGFTAPLGRVIVGREYEGEGEGNVRYATAKITFNGKDVQQTGESTSSPIMESSGTWFKTDDESLLIGRRNMGGFDGNTYYTTSKFKSVLTIYGTDPAPEGSTIVIDTRMESVEKSESSSYFLCEENTVMTGRYHDGDENGTTKYEYATLKGIDKDGNPLDGDVTVEDIKWETVDNESEGPGFDAAVNRVIVGRQHSGDENGKTRYATGIVKYNGHATEIRNYGITAAKKESSWGWFKAEDNQVITGRHHYDDENGNTYYCFGSIYCDVQTKPERPFNIIVAMHPDESCFPMNPNDFIKLSRFRRHHGGASDTGYNKNDNTFHENDSHAEEYYDIDVNVINKFHNTGTYRIFNMRPRDYDHYGDQVFLQPDDNLHGDTKPNRRVPVFSYTTSKYIDNNGNIIETMELHFFFGYNYIKPLGIASGSHQGDWEAIIITFVNNKIGSAWLSQHDKGTNYTADQLEITEVDGVQTLVVYCAIGSHAFYEAAKTTHIYLKGVHVCDDYTKKGGYQWNVLDCVLPLESQEWNGFAGAWGEVGEDLPSNQPTTGPAGPWPKKAEVLAYQDESYTQTPPITENQVLIVPDNRAESEKIKESAGTAFECGENMLITGIKHDGDENGITIYQYATLKAIDSNGQVVTGEITITDKEWTDYYKESESEDFFSALGVPGRVITGRQHSGDENGNTRYQTGIVRFNGKTTKTATFLHASLAVKQSWGFFYKSSEQCVLLKRTHTGDENGITIYTHGFITADIQK